MRAWPTGTARGCARFPGGSGRPEGERGCSSRVGNRAASAYHSIMRAWLTRPRSIFARRLLACLLLLCYGGSFMEAAFGAARDGRIHHESAAAAAVHGAAGFGEHGHEDPGAGAKHGSRHQHGTSGDHCTHPHGIGIPAVCHFALIAKDVPPVTETPVTLFGVRPSTHFRPPKA